MLADFYFEEYIKGKVTVDLYKKQHSQTNNNYRSCHFILILPTLFSSRVLLASC
jgi:hypothetical protein